jgi:hypothetical protein
VEVDEGLAVFEFDEGGFDSEGAGLAIARRRIRNVLERLKDGTAFFGVRAIINRVYSHRICFFKPTHLVGVLETLFDRFHGNVFLVPICESWRLLML